MPLPPQPQNTQNQPAQDQSQEGSRHRDDAEEEQDPEEKRLIAQRQQPSAPTEANITPAQAEPTTPERPAAGTMKRLRSPLVASFPLSLVENFSSLAQGLFQTNTTSPQQLPIEEAPRGFHHHQR